MPKPDTELANGLLAAAQNVLGTISDFDFDDGIRILNIAKEAHSMDFSDSDE